MIGHFVASGQNIGVIVSAIRSALPHGHSSLDFNVSFVASEVVGNLYKHRRDNRDEEVDVFATYLENGSFHLEITSDLQREKSEDIARAIDSARHIAACGGRCSFMSTGDGIGYIAICALANRVMVVPEQGSIVFDFDEKNLPDPMIISRAIACEQEPWAVPK